MHYAKYTNSSLVVIAFPVSWFGVPVLWWHWHWKTDVKGPTSLHQESGGGWRKVEARLELVFCVPIICDVGGWQEGHLALKIPITLIPKGSLPEWLMACGLYWGWERSCSYSLLCDICKRNVKIKKLCYAVPTGLSLLTFWPFQISLCIMFFF